MIGTMLAPVRYARRRSLPLALVLIPALLLFPPLVLLIWVSFTPNAEGLITSHFSLGAYQTIFHSRDLLQVIGNTLSFAAISGVAGGLIGIVACFVAVRSNSRLRVLFYLVPLVTFAVPGVMQVLGWEILFQSPMSTGNVALAHLGLHFNINTFYGMCLLQTFASAALSFIVLIGPMGAMSHELEEAAQVSGASPRSVFLRITLPLLAPALASGMLLATMLSFQSLEVPLILGAPSHIETIASAIYIDISATAVPTYSVSAAFGCLLAVVLLVMYVAYVRLTRLANRYATITGRSYRSTKTSLGTMTLPIGVLAVVIVTIAVVPGIVMLWLSLSHSPSGIQLTAPSHFGLQNFHQFAQYPQILRSFADSAVIGAVSASGACLLGMAVAYRATRSGDGLSRTGEALMNLPLAIPIVAFGFAELVLSLNSPIHLYGTLWIFILFDMIAFAPFVLRVYGPALISISRELEDAARIAGAGGLRAFVRITAPLLGRTFWAVWIFVFMLVFREFGGSIFLTTANTPVVGVQMYDMWFNGQLPVLSALATIVGGIGVGALVALVVIVRLKRKTPAAPLTEGGLFFGAPVEATGADGELEMVGARAD